MLATEINTMIETLAFTPQPTPIWSGSETRFNESKSSPNCKLPIVCRCSRNTTEYVIQTSHCGQKERQKDERHRFSF